MSANNSTAEYNQREADFIAAAEREEAEALVELSEMLSLMKIRARVARGKDVL